MPRPHRNLAPRADGRRAEILAAALDCFSTLGYERTTLADVRQRSGASTGSIYHHFGSKEGLAAALYTDGIATYQAGYWDALRRRRTPQAGIEAIVAYHLQWVQDHPAWSRYLFQQRHLPAVVEKEPTLEALNQAFLTRVGGWFASHIAAGRLRPLPADTYVAVLMGPCQEYARTWLAGRAQTPPARAAKVLAAAAWRAVRGADTSEV